MQCLYLRGMEYLTRLKLSPVESLADARFAAASGFTYMGFCFDPASKDFMVPIRAKEIIEWTTGAHTVGEFGEQDAAGIKDLSALLNLDIVQLSNNLLPDELAQLELPVIKTINATNFSDLQIAREMEAYGPVVAAFQLEGRMPDVESLKSWCAQYPVILNYSSANLHDLVLAVKPFGVNLSPGKEEKTGIQDFEILQDTIDSLRS